IAQRAALVALESPMTWFDPIRAHYRVRRDAMVAAVRASEGLDCVTPDGGFFVWVDMSRWNGKQLAGRRIERSEDFADAMLDEAPVAMMPGTGFGDPNMLRLAFANGDAELDEAMRRVRQLTSGRPVAR